MEMENGPGATPGTPTQDRITLQPGQLSKPEKVWVSSSALIIGFYQAAPYSDAFKILYKKPGAIFGTQITLTPASILGPELAVRQPMAGEVQYFEYEIKKLKPSTQYVVKVKTGDDATEVRSDKMGTVSLEEERNRNNVMSNFVGALVKLGDYDGLVLSFAPATGIFAIRILQIDDVASSRQLTRVTSEYTDNGITVQAYTLSQVRFGHWGGAITNSKVVNEGELKWLVARAVQLGDKSDAATAFEARQRLLQAQVEKVTAGLEAEWAGRFRNLKLRAAMYLLMLLLVAAAAGGGMWVLLSAAGARQRDLQARLAASGERLAEAEAELQLLHLYRVSLELDIGRRVAAPADFPTHHPSFTNSSSASSTCTSNGSSSSTHISCHINSNSGGNASDCGALGNSSSADGLCSGDGSSDASGVAGSNRKNIAAAAAAAATTTGKPGEPASTDPADGTSSDSGNASGRKQHQRKPADGNGDETVTKAGGGSRKPTHGSVGPWEPSSRRNGDGGVDRRSRSTKDSGKRSRQRRPSSSSGATSSGGDGDGHDGNSDVGSRGGPDGDCGGDAANWADAGQLWGLPHAALRRAMSRGRFGRVAAGSRHNGGGGGGDSLYEQHESAGEQPDAWTFIHYVSAVYAVHLQEWMKVQLQKTVRRKVNEMLLPTNANTLSETGVVDADAGGDGSSASDDGSKGVERGENRKSRRSAAAGKRRFQRTYANGDYDYDEEDEGQHDYQDFDGLTYDRGYY
ncbi:hypothetical protein Agub_g14873 [Astrephomene gubernaculifera]|uniref:Uncharacterized protein n=1 Tax=Astrephomene gubernaculifera TaxID=47775 RepID=A0AAD3E2P7_9CHLO|nr:hypothetical protein Agub_g14873 [Astrephomene gubernaculifera]